jgi:murein DD-endopeptidase MepM/ murein hydrolase activator NlpD
MVKTGDTISGIAKKFNADAKEILSFNGIEDPKEIQPGLDLIIPDAEPIKVVAKPSPKPAPKPTSSTSVSAANQNPQAKVSEDADKEEDKNEEKPTNNSSSGFVHPAPGSVLTQGYHAVNAVDFGGKTGTPIRAAAAGTVIVAKGSGAYNGGFGNMIVISHENGSQTLYAHLSKVQVTVGDSVDQGEQIGLMGNTGKSTGPHLHFEAHNAKNPWTKDKKYTQY